MVRQFHSGESSSMRATSDTAVKASENAAARERIRHTSHAPLCWLRMNTICPDDRRTIIETLDLRDALCMSHLFLV
jgi:hypothetical protein